MAVSHAQTIHLQSMLNKHNRTDIFDEIFVYEYLLVFTLSIRCCSFELARVCVWVSGSVCLPQFNFRLVQCMSCFISFLLVLQPLKHWFDRVIGNECQFARWMKSICNADNVVASKQGLSFKLIYWNTNDSDCNILTWNMFDIQFYFL